MRRTIAAYALAALLFPTLARPQSSSLQSSTLQVYSRLTIVDVTATDSAGEPVHGLQASDFTIEEDGKPQPIRNFEEVRASWQEPPRQLPPNVYTNLQPPSPSAAVNILLLDFANEAPIDATDLKQVAASTETQKYVKDAAIRAMDSMPPGTRIAVLSMTNSLRLLQSFTSDRDILKAAINAAPYDLTGTGNEQGVQRNERNYMVLEVFDQIAASTAAMKVRKNLIWFSMGNPDLTDPNHNPDIPNYTNALFKTYAELMAEQISIYPIDARALSATGLARETEAQLSMDAIANATGGVAYYNTNDLSTDVLKAINHGSNYYSIAYVPPSRGYDGAFHAISVKINRPGIHLVYRNGYYAEDTRKFNLKPGLTLTLTPPPAPKGNMKAPMSRGEPLSSDILFTVAIQPSTTAPKPGAPPILGTLDPRLKNHPLVRYTLQYIVPSEQFRFTPGPNNTHKGAAEFDVAVYNLDSKLLTGLSQTLNMPMSDDTYQKIVQQHTPLRFTQQIDLPHGQLFVRVGILDPATEKTGTLELPLHVGRNGTQPSAPDAPTADQ